MQTTMQTTSEHLSSTAARGYTITELMVALALMAVVSGQLMLVLQTQNKSHADQARVLEAQQDVRLSTELILSDLRMSGFLVPGIVGMSSADGGTGAPDVVCASDPSVFPESSITGATELYETATAVSVVGAGATAINVLPSTLDIDGDGTDDFTVDSGIIFSDGTGSHCARITSIAGGTIGFTPPTPAGFSVPASSATEVVPAVVYEVDATGLRRNNIVLSPLVENLQIEYGVDRNANGQIDAGEFPVHDLNDANPIFASDPSLIMGAQISLITRTSLADPDFSGPGMPGSANHTGGAADGFKRRRITAIVTPRNL